MALSLAEIQAIIAAGTEHRGWIANSFAQIEFLLGDVGGVENFVQVNASFKAHPFENSYQYFQLGIA